MQSSKRWMAALMAAALAVPVLAADKAEVRLRDVDFDGLMGIDASLSLTATFDVKGGDLFDELRFDFYILLEPRGKEQGPLFFHCRTIHRFLEEGSGYKSGAVLPQKIVKCINPRGGEYAVVATLRGEEVGLENSSKERWWEDGKLGKPIEHVLNRSTGAPVVRTWETD